MTNTTKYSFIVAPFNDFISILDARAQITVYEIDDNDNKTLRFDCARVYDLLTIEKKVFRNYEVCGISCDCLSMDIYIKKA